jgi:rod shape-determining protein MreC
LRNIFLFIRRHFNLLLFLSLQIFSVYLIVTYNEYHRAVFTNTANNLSGGINTKYAGIQQYFYLKKTNDSLLKANESLYNKLKADFSLPDSLPRTYIDSMKVDSFVKYRKYSYLGAKVVSNSVTNQSNYIVLDKGKNHGVKEGMGVIDPNSAVVGIVTEVTEEYAVVMSLLHKDSHISGKLQKGGETGILSWNGVDPNYISISNISKSAKVLKGDTIISSGFSTALPKGMYIGFVEALYKESSSNFYKIKFRSAANFHNIQYVYVIQNADQDGVKDALDKIKKQP